MVDGLIIKTVILVKRFFIPVYGEPSVSGYNTMG
jgi:hypothetical protein